MAFFNKKLHNTSERTSLFTSIANYFFQVVQRVVFLHEDLIKLPSFPRKALEAELDLHANGEIGKVSILNLYSPPSLILTYILASQNP